MRAQTDDYRNGDGSTGWTARKGGICLGKPTRGHVEADVGSTDRRDTWISSYRIGAHRAVNGMAGALAMISLALFIWLIIRVGVHFAK
jgi:hypothetical protein